MKNRNSKIAMLLILAISLMSFTTLTKKTVDIEKSKVNWKGYKVTGQHQGTINIKNGTLSFDGETLTGGTFVMDMTSINTTDLEGKYKGKLDGHLKSADFFGVEKFPTALLEFINVSGKDGSYKVKANLTIKETTKTVEFSMSIKENTATASLEIDRTEYDIKYGSSSFFDDLKDKAIYDNFDLNVSLTF
ncbi:YceI family protein [uncultured Winogradskyella sp.]|uniref:YceI family protein n=1 Tax=uncultured Winogradskyella sp. TaxID=395353 RepID=UPI0030DBABF4|tara:strand:+ start:250 stop:819 length:570 start_codon:yes stop_codon:yes gene_type:complete